MIKKRFQIRFLTPLLIMFVLSSCGVKEEIQPTITIIPTETLTPIFEDNLFIKDYYDEYPKSDCVTKSYGWKCSTQVEDFGMWHLSYGKSSFVEVYHSYVIDFEGLLKETIFDVIVKTGAVIAPDSLQETILDWIFDKGIPSAAENKHSIIEHTIRGMHIFLGVDSSESILFLTLCYGGGCPEMDLSLYQSDLENLPT